MSGAKGDKVFGKAQKVQNAAKALAALPFASTSIGLFDGFIEINFNSFMCAQIHHIQPIRPINFDFVRANIPDAINAILTKTRIIFFVCSKWIFPLSLWNVAFL
jgi:hypothetical protein